MAIRSYRREDLHRLGPVRATVNTGTHTRLAVLVLAMAANAAQADEAWRPDARLAGEAAGRLIACGAHPERMFSFWRATVNPLEFRVPDQRDAIAAEFLTSMMIGMQARIPPRECTRMLGILHQRLGPAP
ncbi:hypothetical protein [Falsiroseomonas tokyonensis]|uniref:Rap1a immunity protein domain-containing protein n=1 Tax=Falsiroseomonas tokyonensis TaxID=430521 RepID=A0ABV7C1W9_9PROT|nr:hypothetical protein [Falsiroseomonas tokyonensis]MBU8541246.1 hypothetical protein [Falsiroseomonas tokyonensis]